MKKYVLLVVLVAFSVRTAYANESKGFLEKVHSRTTLTSTIPDNGDQNPYAVVVAPVSSGKIQKGDVLVDNFNNAKNLQGTGTTIIDYNPATKKISLFAKIPDNLKKCPGGGVGLSTAMTILKSGWIIVGSTPSKDGTTGTKSEGCLIVLDANGNVAGTISGPNINDPWGNMAVIDNDTTATLFVSNAGFGVGAPDASSTNVNKATVLRIDLAIPAGKPPIVKSQTIIANGLSERADKDVFLIGPTGLALSNQSTLYVSDALNNRIIAIDKATTRQDSAGTGREITKDGLLHQPLAMTTAPNGNLVVTNGKNGQAVEVDPVTGKQVFAQWLDTDKAQTPPGNGDLFGIATNLSGDGLYYVEDDVNTLVSIQ
jgi:hypothetical protein